ncbi:Cys-Gln thioester bond-forming surface protein, partial [Corynebacterium striatum]|uniref:Cys-Gln thioester bond-forming surface protein n=1 Tax=Corynebacterium striatum TaxID=43770 RepID=UPI001EF532E4|nr:Cys-Gln thioester bond-forming surface protein [Corynebacterium striatum]
MLALILAFAMVLSQTVFAKAQTGQYQGAEAEPGSNLFQIRPIGTTDWEVAYCINLHAAYPTPEVKQDPNNPLTFDLSDDPSDLTKFTENKDPALTKQLLTVMWNGGPNDAAGLVSSKELTDVQLRTVTQYAIWHLTDNFNGARDLSGSMLQVYKVMIGASQSESLPFGKQFTMQQLPEGAKLNVFTPTNNIKPPSGYSQWQNLLSSQFLDRNDKPLKPTPSEPSNPGVEEKSVNFAKLDKATQQPVSGAKLRLERQLLNSTINGEAQDYDWTTDGNTATVKLAPGEYLIKELQVPQGYKPLVENAKTPIAQVIVTEEGTVTINSQTGVVYDGGIVKIFNESTASHDEHDVVISKTDIAGKEIAGAQIEVWSTGDDAKKLFDWTSV